MSSDIRAFGTSIAETYQSHLVPILFDLFAKVLAGRVLQNGATEVLDVAGGTGIVATSLVSGARVELSVVVTDLSRSMLDAGQRHLAATNVRWEVADGCHLPFADSTFDAVTCQFGLMFLPDPAEGLREAKRVLHSEGAFYGLVWNARESNRLWETVEEAFCDLLPDEPRPIMPTPFLLSDPGILRSLAQDAGFSEITIEEIRVTHDDWSPEEAAIGFIFGTPMHNFLLSVGMDLDQAKLHLTQKIASRLGDPFVTELSAWLCIAKHSE